MTRCPIAEALKRKLKLRRRLGVVLLVGYHFDNGCPFMSAMLLVADKLHTHDFGRN